MITSCLIYLGGIQKFNNNCLLFIMGASCHVHFSTDAQILLQEVPELDTLKIIGIPYRNLQILPRYIKFLLYISPCSVIDYFTIILHVLEFFACSAQPKLEPLTTLYSLQKAISIYFLQ